MGRYRSIFVGAPEFAVDQRVVVFLGARGPSVPYVLGLSQGVYRIVPRVGRRLDGDAARPAAHGRGVDADRARRRVAPARWRSLTSNGACARSPEVPDEARDGGGARVRCWPWRRPARRSRT